ncbi:MAG: hypothetical protein ACKVLE_03780 [Fidelibacterota bacterium]
MLVSRRLAWISTEYFKSSGNVKEKASASRQETKAFRVYWDKDSNLLPSGYETHALSSIFNWLETNGRRFNL